MIAQLTGIAEADPTKGVGIAMAGGAKSSKALEKEQTLYRDKAEEAATAFSQSMAKEEDARKRGDVKGIIDAKASQQKNQFDYGKYMTELQNSKSHAVSAGASASQAATAARRADLEALLNPSKILENEARAKQYEASAKAAEAGIESKSAKEDRLAREKAEQLFDKDPVVIATAKYIDPKDGEFRPGTPEYNVLAQYLSDVRQARIDSVVNKTPYVAPPPPTVVKEIVEKNFFTKDKTKDVLVPGRPAAKATETAPPVTSSASTGSKPIPAGLPPGTVYAGPSGGKDVYRLPDGKLVW
jgi:hypothetical protein